MNCKQALIVVELSTKCQEELLLKPGHTPVGECLFHFQVRVNWM